MNSSLKNKNDCLIIGGAIVLISLMGLIGLYSDVLALSNDSSKKPSLVSDLDGLGGNRPLMEKAKILSTDNKMRIVQKRLVERDLRFELGLNYGLVGGGDNYYNTQNIGGNLEFHINPRWSLGYRYYQSRNRLTQEGKRIFQEASQRRAINDLNYRAPDMEYPFQTHLFAVSWYPIYGKLNLFDLGVTQFDLYVLAGAGGVELSNQWRDTHRWTETYTLGAGFAYWWTQHISSRIEGRYQTYSDQVYTGSRRQDLIIGTLSLGVLL